MGWCCHNPERGVEGDNSCVPCIPYKKDASMVKEKINFFCLNYCYAANQDMFVNNRYVVLSMVMGRWCHNPDRGVKGG